MCIQNFRIKNYFWNIFKFFIAFKMAIFKFGFVRQNVPKLSNNRRPLFTRILPSNSPIEFIPARFYEFDANIFGCSARERPTGNAGLEAQKAFLRQNVEEKSVKSLVNAFRRFGHLKAKIDPLGLAETERILELEPEIYGFDEESLQKPLQEGGQATMADMIEHLEELYAGNMAVEFMHLQNPEERQFFAKIYEEMAREEIGPKEKIGALEGMLKMKTWENFIALKFPTLKRYSGEGAESMFAFYRQLLEECPKYEISEIIWGGAHRGRIALQTVLFKFPAGQIFRKMRGLRELPENVEGMGDVLTHLHSHLDYEAENGELVHLSTLPNPSHLEASISAVVGKARGRAQTMRVGDYGGGIVGDAILPVHHHGDGAFTGQGIVWETLAMSQVPNFRVGGSIHLIVNNQLAFTADRRIGRSSRHCTDVAKAIDCPVIHVNAENIEKVILAAKIALAYRHRFRKEIFVELVAYRKYGHNELDDPRITQPKMYRSVDAKKCLVEKFGKKLEEENLLEKEEIEKMVEEYKEELKRELELVDMGKTEAKVDHFGGYWQGFGQAKKEMSKWDTGVNAELLKFIGAKSVEIPREFIVHPNVQRAHIEGRMKKIKANEIDWSTAEAMAIGSALLQGFDVRLSGQDVGRATFSHRHAMLVCQQTERVHIPLNHLNEGQNSFVEIANSPLSEASVLGFEYGFSIEHPKRLTIWEAQFGDFYNGAQIQIDTLIASGESKWLLQNGLVIILPHGFDGAGPDHSSAHIERFLALTDSGEGQSPADGDNVNMAVAQPTNSAQYFHLLRRQIVTPFRKPLVIISPKLLLRHPSTICPFSHFAEGTTFKSVLKDPKVGDPKKVKNLILCSGKHAVTLMEEREKRGIESDGMAIVRLEGICPFPVDELSEMFGEYSNAKNIIWSQEEPRNAGCWPFVQPRMKNAFGIQLEYCGRPELAWMATPIAEVHKREIDDVLNSTFSF